MELSDADLLERWRSGDRQAGFTLFERYYASIERFFINKVSTDISDLVQETFMACVERRDSLHDGSKFRSYLFSIAYNVFRDYMRRKYRRHDEVDLEEVSVAGLSPSPSTVLAHRAEQRLLLEGLRRLPVHDQVILELRYWENLSITDLAVIMNIPTPAVKSRLRRARARLEQTMKELASSPEILTSTMTNLDAWANRARSALAED